MVEVFKTTVQKVEESNRIIQQIRLYFPDSQVSFDLEDCDKVLRIAGNGIVRETVISLLHAAGYKCQELP